MSATQSPLLFVHGGLHGGACWDGVIDRLARAGRRAEAFDLPGQGRDATPRATIGISDYVARAVERLDALGEPATVVCHSFGGITATALADARPDKVAALIYVAAVVPASGLSLNEASNRARDGRFESALTAFEPEVSHTIDPSEAAYFFYHDCAPDVTARAIASLCPQTIRPMREPVPLSGAGLKDIPKAYIRCLQDRVLALPIQDLCAQRYAGTRVIDMDTGHSPFLASEEAFVNLLLAIERDLNP